MAEPAAKTQAATPPPSNPETPPSQTSPAGAAKPAAPDGGPPAGDKPLAAGGGKTDDKVETPANWPSNWREIMAGGNDKFLATLNRFDSPANVFKSWANMRQQRDTGEVVRAKPEGDPNDPVFQREMNEWRAQAGIPEKPEGYLDKVPDGLVFGENDKPLLDGFLKDMHAKDVPPAYVHEALRWYKANEERIVNDRAEADRQHRAVAEDNLRAEWGPEYRPIMNGVHALISTYGSQDLAEELYSARLADGTPLGDHPSFLKFMAALNREINPTGTVAPAGKTQAQALDDRIGELKKMMSDKNSDYWKGPNRDALQAEYRGLIEQRDRRNQRAA